MNRIVFPANMLFCLSLFAKNYDLTIVGPIMAADGLGRIPVGLIETLSDRLSINHIWNSKGAIENLKGLSKQVNGIYNDKDKTPGSIAIMTFPVWYGNIPAYKFVPKSSFIKIAYSMLEGTAIPPEWVQIFNNTFDLVVVPDEYYKEVYENSGVNKPIFVLPHGIYLEPLLKEPLHEQKDRASFVFGCSAAVWPRKNLELLVDAFAAEFKNAHNVKLVIHARNGLPDTVAELRKKIRSHKATNIKFFVRTLSQANYFDLLKEIDCYVLLSKGEGFSVTPREILALGIPCILSNNTAHKTICQTNLVTAIECPHTEPAFYANIFGANATGVQFNCRIEDVRRALRNVYEQYPLYLERAALGRRWVTQYQWKNLKAKFLNLVKPQKILLGEDNVISDTFFMTNDINLYNKYLKLKTEF